MVSQLFKNDIPIDLLIKLLQIISIKTDTGYIINKSVYKRGMFTDSINNFIQECKPYYHASKYKYVNPPITYNLFITIIRQICNFNKIKYTSRIKYEKSNYDIIYSIFLNDIL
jgi:hypothetical protein